MQIYYLVNQLGEVIAKDLSKEQVQTLLHLLFCNVETRAKGIASVTGLAAPTVTVIEDEVAYQFSSSVEDEYGWSWHTVITDANYNVLYDKLSGDWTATTPHAIVERGKGKPLCRSLLNLKTFKTN